MCSIKTSHSIWGAGLCGLLLLCACQGELEHRSFADDDLGAMREVVPDLEGLKVKDMTRAPDTGDAEPIALLPVYGHSTVRLLTPRQYHNAITQLSPAPITHRDVGSYTSSLSAASGGLNVGLVEDYSDEAFEVAAQWFATPESTQALVGCVPSGTANDMCAREFITDFGYLVWRRPLTLDEVDRYVTLSVDVATRLQSPSKGVEYTVAGLLQSPYFLYRVELGESEGTRRAFDSYEIATRLSFMLTNQPPSRELLDAARDGRLHTPQDLEREARALLASPAGERGLRALGTELYGLDAITQVEKEPTLFPEFSKELAEAMREQIAQTFVEHTTSGRDYRELFNRRDIFMHPSLVDLYDARDFTGDDWELYTFPESANRQGILSLAGIMASHSGIANTSPTTRGFFVRTDVLCDVVPPPGPDVDTTLPEPAEGELLTNRELLGRHVTEVSCAGCHAFMDPLGFPLENYDPIGRHRTHQNMQVIDASGSLDGVAFDNARGFSDVLAEHPDVIPCLNKKLFAYSFARLMLPEDEALMQELNGAFQGSGHDLREALVALAVSDAMRFAKDDVQGEQP